MPDVMFYEAQGKQCRLCSPFWEDFILSGIQDLGVNPLAEWGGGGGVGSKLTILYHVLFEHL